MNAAEQKRAAREFVERWQAMPCVEEEHSRSFWIELVHDVLGVEQPTRVLEFERKVRGRKIDVFYEDMGILIEQKGRGVSLDKASERSKRAGAETPFQQAKWYADNLVWSARQHLRWILTCNFDEFRVYDLDVERPEDAYVSFTLAELPEQLHLLAFFTDKANSRIEREMQLSADAGALVGKLYAGLAGRYRNLDADPREQRSLNILVVRLVFLLYAEDCGLLQEKDALLNYLREFRADQMRQAVLDLFEVLDTPDGSGGTQNLRDPYLPDALAAFPYVNGGLFSDADVVVPQFTEEIRLDLLVEASRKFDWSQINPTIFGAVFESTLNPATRHAGGMHYTSIENIHKAIDPLFLDDLRAELDEIEAEKVEKRRRLKLRAFQDKLASIRVLDPACGSGNFLTESYLSLRRLENLVLESLRDIGANAGQTALDVGGELSVKVSIDQFFGIEVNDFAVSVAKTALWIAEEQMLDATAEVLQTDCDFLPLKSNGHLVEGNALALDWNEVLPAAQCSYIVGNPPFLGYSNQTREQKADLLSTWTDARGKQVKGAGKLDYVSCWHYLASRYMQDNPRIRAAFVSTNSICQGEQACAVWKNLAQLFSTRIDFAWQTFVWDSEAADKAHVHVVVVGFSVHPDAEDGERGGAHAALLAGEGEGASTASQAGEKDGAHAALSAGEGAGADAGGTRPLRLFRHDAQSGVFEESRPAHINAYLCDAPDVYIEPRRASLCAAPAMTTGNRPADGGHLIVEDACLASFIRDDPAAKEWIRPFLGSREFINGIRRWCLWLVECPDAQIDAMPLVRERVAACRADRLAAPDAGRRKLACAPKLFREQVAPQTPYLVVPKVSSERRAYVPIGYVDGGTVCSDLLFIVPQGGLYHFGVLHSRVHNAWMRMVCGRLESRYRYSQALVYNNFPWPGATPETLPTPVEDLVAPAVRERVEACAQAVLDARAAHPGCTLAELYDPDKTPADLSRAHAALDAAVEGAYGVSFAGDEEAIVAHLFTLYAALAA